MYSSALRRGLAAEAPDRFVDPVPFEPLFEVAARHGYRWSDANVRGAEVGNPGVVAAVGSDGTVLSDHDAVAVTVRPGGRPSP
jgi:hypothetical protein